MVLPVDLALAELTKPALAGAHVPALDNESTRRRYVDYLSGISAAICDGWRHWQVVVTLTGVAVNGPFATGGRFVGPDLDAFVLSRAPERWDEFNNAISGAFCRGFSAWSQAVVVPGLAWYPHFAAFPAPWAPPTPNLPSPLLLIAPAVGLMSRAVLSEEMRRRLTVSGWSDRISLAVIGAMASALETYFLRWLNTTFVTNVLGSGPVPSFCLPNSPIGPVVNGTATMAPGGLQ